MAESTVIALHAKKNQKHGGDLHCRTENSDPGTHPSLRRLSRARQRRVRDHSSFRIDECERHRLVVLQLQYHPSAAQGHRNNRATERNLGENFAPASANLARRKRLFYCEVDMRGRSA